MSDATAVQVDEQRTADTCRAWVGPIWKLGGETCVCIEPAGHVERKDATFGADHLCSCGAWFVDQVAHPA